MKSSYLSFTIFVYFASVTLPRATYSVPVPEISATQYAFGVITASFMAIGSGKGNSIFVEANDDYTFDVDDDDDDDDNDDEDKIDDGTNGEETLPPGAATSAHFRNNLRETVDLYFAEVANQEAIKIVTLDIDRETAMNTFIGHKFFAGKMM